MTELSVPKFPITVGDTEYTCEIAQVDYYQFGYDDHGFQDKIGFKGGGGWGQGTGGYKLAVWDKEAQKEIGTAFGMDYIMECIRTLGPIGTTGQQVVIFRNSPKWNELIVGWAALNADGSIGEPFFPKELAKKHFPDRED